MNRSIAASTENTDFPMGPDVSIAWVTDTKSMPRAWNCSKANTSSRVDLAKRSNFQTACQNSTRLRQQVAVLASADWRSTILSLRLVEDPIVVGNEK
jgi:hypothetical protein